MVLLTKAYHESIHLRVFCSRLHLFAPLATRTNFVVIRRFNNSIFAEEESILLVLLHGANFHLVVELNRRHKQ